MLLNKIFVFRREENRRSGKDRRKSDPLKFKGQEKRSHHDRRSGKDRRSDIEFKSGMYYKLSDKRKDLVDTLIDVLEQEDTK